MYTIFSFTLAIIPTILLVRYFYKQDSLKQEPKGLIIKVFFLGILSTIPILVIEILLGEINKLFDASSIQFFAFKAFVVAAFSEELLKFLVVRYYPYRKIAFDEAMDGIVYAVTAGLGFACLENIIYVINNGLLTALIRAFTAVPLHALAAGVMGYYIGEAKFVRDNKTRTGLFIRGLMYAILIHGIYDFVLFISPAIGFWISLVVIPVLYISYRVLKQKIKAAKTEDLVMERV